MTTLSRSEMAKIRAELPDSWFGFAGIARPAPPDVGGLRPGAVPDALDEPDELDPKALAQLVVDRRGW